MTQSVYEYDVLVDGQIWPLPHFLRIKEQDDLTWPDTVKTVIIKKPIIRLNVLVILHDHLLVVTTRIGVLD